MLAAGNGNLFDFTNKSLLPRLHRLNTDIHIGLPSSAASRKQHMLSA